MEEIQLMLIGLVTKNTTRVAALYLKKSYQDVMLQDSQPLKSAVPSQLYLNFLQDKVEKRVGGNPINVNRLSN